jgi:hypothetical protein
MSEATGRLGQHRLGDVVHAGRHAEAQLSPFAARQRACRLVEALPRRHRRPRRTQELATRRGDPHAVSRALEHLDAHLGLQALDLLAQRRLGNVQAPRRPAEVQLVGKHDK